MQRLSPQEVAVLRRPLEMVLEALTAQPDVSLDVAGAALYLYSCLATEEDKS